MIRSKPVIKQLPRFLSPSIRSSSTKAVPSLSKSTHPNFNIGTPRTHHASPIVNKSLTDRIIMNAMQKVQQMIIRESELTRPVEDGFQSDSMTPVESYLINNETDVNYLMTQLPTSTIPAHIRKTVEMTHDSHIQLNTLLDHLDAFDIPPELYLQSYLKVRYNVNQQQMRDICSKLLAHRWYTNASLIILENSNSLDNLLEETMNLLRTIQDDLQDSPLGINQFFQSFPNKAVLPQVLKNYVTSTYPQSSFLYLRSFKRLLQLQSILVEQLKFVSHYDSLVELSMKLDLLAGNPKMVPVSLRLTMIDIKLKYIRHKYGDHGTNAVKNELENMIRSELEMSANVELMRTKGVISRLVSILGPNNLDFLIDLVPQFELINSIDLCVLVRSCRNVEPTRLASLYQYVMEKQLPYDKNFIAGLIDRLRLTPYCSSSSSLLLEILSKHHQEISLYHTAVILCAYRKDDEKFKQVMSLIDPSHYGYVLGALGRQICMEYEMMIRSRNSRTPITFDEIFSIVDILKGYKVNHVSYLKNVFDTVIMDRHFIEMNKPVFNESLIRLAGSSRVNLELLADWHFQLFSKYNLPHNKFNHDQLFINVPFTRKFLVRTMRLQTKDRRNTLLKQFGVALSVLPHEVVIELVNEVLATLHLERGRNVVDFKVVPTMLRNVLDSYIESSLFQVSDIKEQYQQLSKVLKSLKFPNGNNRATQLLVSNAKHMLMQSLVELDHDLAFKIISNESDTSLLKGYLLGLLSSERLSSDQKIHKFELAYNRFFKSKGKLFIGEKVSIGLCNLIIRKLNDNEISRLTKTYKFIWALRHCQKNGVKESMYRQWYDLVKQMKDQGRGYWSGSGNSQEISRIKGI